MLLWRRRYRSDPEIFELGVPTLGICYGLQLMARSLGAEVKRGTVEEYGSTDLDVLQRSSVLFAKLPKRQRVWMIHADAVIDAPKGFDAVAATGASPVAAMEDVERRLFSVQFHPEVSHTDHGREILQRFLYEGAGLRRTWKVSSIIDTAVDAIQRQVGDATAVCALSGGVDSAVAAALVYRAIGDRLTCVFVDHGLLREGEAKQVETTFKHMFGRNFISVHAAKTFLEALGEGGSP